MCVTHTSNNLTLLAAPRKVSLFDTTLLWLCTNTHGHIHIHTHSCIYCYTHIPTHAASHTFPHSHTQSLALTLAFSCFFCLHTLCSLSFPFCCRCCCCCEDYGFLCGTQRQQGEQGEKQGDGLRHRGCHQAGHQFCCYWLQRRPGPRLASSSSL